MRGFAARAAAGMACAALIGCVANPGDMNSNFRLRDESGYTFYSWGKPGVSRKDYDDASVDCVLVGAIEEVRPPLEEFFAPVDPLTDPRALQDTQAARDRAVRRARQEVIDDCLRELGFVRFGLTEAQLATLGGYARGTPERRAYLYSLGSDPEIVRAQAVE